jgi:hypothetical protein
MPSLIKHKILYIHNFNILLFNYNQLLIVFKEIEDLIHYNYKVRNINKIQIMQYEIVLLDIKFSHCKRHIEYFRFSKMVRIKSMPMLLNNLGIV